MTQIEEVKIESGKYGPTYCYRRDNFLGNTPGILVYNPPKWLVWLLQKLFIDY